MGEGGITSPRWRGRLRASSILKPVAFLCPGELAMLGCPSGKSESTGLRAGRSNVVTIKINSCDYNPGSVHAFVALD